MAPRHERSPARAFHAGPVNRLSVVMPVFDEEATIAEAIDNVLAAPLPKGVKLELIIVESNSTDDTRKLVEKYERVPSVQLVLQDKARGKGNAVREGFRHVTGDIVLIQDGDMEYRVEDYPKLLEPIIAGEVDFVLGSRHTRDGAMRHFADAKHVSAVMNAAHWLFATLFNLFYGTRLRDPFTMYKVFRAECIEGMPFVADRFDFDFELAAKLVRRGYRPREIPVNYFSRGYESGKKVRFFRDPLTWVAALVRFRVARVPRRINAPVVLGDRGAA